MIYPIQFGFCVPIFAAPGAHLFRTPNYTQLNTATTMNLARTADALGYDSLWVADHLMLGHEQAILEGWTTLAALAGSTQRAKLGIIHQAHFFRHPALAAKMTATLDLISNGRFIYFVDGGTRSAEHIAYGLPWFETFEERIARMLEGLELTLALWQAQEPINFEGRYYHVKEAACTPLPVQKPHPPIWFGEAHPLTLQACAKYAQAWNTVPVGLDELQRRLQALAVACDEAGRPFDDIEKTLEIQILIAPDHAAIRRKLNDILALNPAGAKINDELRVFLSAETDEIPVSLSDTWIIGTPDEVNERVKLYIGMGFSHFMLWFVDVPDEDGLRLFMEQVAPHFKSVSV
jgi:alkanesulfonate monooxygenase SsuD/methylene tetrahydromethanopterin reductase-like flavin-dependent oxidoreductase (luciferase family)